MRPGACMRSRVQRRQWCERGQDISDAQGRDHAPVESVGKMEDEAVRSTMN